MSETYGAQLEALFATKVRKGVQGGLSNSGTRDRKILFYIHSLNKRTGSLLIRFWYRISTQREKFLLSCILSRDTEKCDAGKV